MADRNEYHAARSREKYAAQAEVGPIPEVVNKRRRKSCERNLFKFLTTYFPATTSKKPFSEDHRRVIDRIQSCCLDGGRFTNAVYRGFAKTTISENSAIWAMLYGHRRFVLIVGINTSASAENIESIRSELAENDLLYDDFPEVCHPIRELDGKPQRAQSQTCDGKHTRIRWRSDGIVLPTVDGSIASGAILCAKPYAKARGVKFKRTDGAQVRPDLALVDDPQDDESAVSTDQVHKNINFLKKGIIPSAGHNKKLAIVINATVIAKDDMVETLLADPAWQGERIPMIEKWANAHDSFWLDKYAAVRKNFDKHLPGSQIKAHKAATSLYRKNRKLADEGCIVSWKHCYDEDSEISAIQHAYNAYIDDGPEVFASEYQNQPMDMSSSANHPLRLTKDILLKKLSGVERGKVPKECEHLTAYIDIGGDVFHWVASAWADNFSGGVIDYGTFPEQPLYFSKKNVPHPLSSVFPGMDQDAYLLLGLNQLIEKMLARSFIREDNRSMTIEKILVDIKWGEKNKLLRSWCRRHKHHGRILHAAQGYGIGATSVPMQNYKPDGAKRGEHYRIGPVKDGDIWITIDTNWWKSLAASRLALPLGTPGSWTICGRPDIDKHDMLIDHLCEEEPVDVTAKGFTVTEWKTGKGVVDNDYWDCIVGSAVAGSMLGSLISGMKVKKSRAEAQSAFMASVAGRMR